MREEIIGTPEGILSIIIQYYTTLPTAVHNVRVCTMDNVGDYCRGRLGVDGGFWGVVGGKERGMGAYGLSPHIDAV